MKIIFLVERHEHGIVFFRRRKEQLITGEKKTGRNKTKRKISHENRKKHQQEKKNKGKEQKKSIKTIKLISLSRETMTHIKVSRPFRGERERARE